MPTPVPRDELAEAVRTQSFIRLGQSNCVVEFRYHFRFHRGLLRITQDRRIQVLKFDIKKDNVVTLGPQEVVFVTTRESIDLPSDMKLQLFPRERMSRDGIVILGGLEVEPCYAGRLLVGLYNTTDVPFSVDEDTRIVSGVFYNILERELLNN